MQKELIHYEKLKEILIFNQQMPNFLVILKKEIV